MKRSIEAFIAALLLAAAAPAAQAVSPIAKIKAGVVLNQKGHQIHIDARFSTDTPGAPLLTLEQAVILFPDHAGTNGRLFPSCDARQIERLHGDVARCPKGSKIGDGTVKAQLFSLGLAVSGRVTIFNSHHGKSLTFNVQTTTPAEIDESFDAPLELLHDRVYGEKLTMRDPMELKQPLPGVWVGVQDFDVTVGAQIRVHGVTRQFFAARACPKNKIHGSFDFFDSATGQRTSTTADEKCRCKLP
jgi:hypothetical protein